MHCLIIVLSVVISHSVIMTEACVCHKIYLPVCGSDGKTYGNECEFNCALNKLKNNDDEESNSEIDLHIIHYRSCALMHDEFSQCPCFRDLDYVCGSDNITYESECILNCIVSEDKKMAGDKASKNFDVKVAYHGKCTDEQNTSSTESKLVNIVMKKSKL